MIDQFAHTDARLVIQYLALSNMREVSDRYAK